MAALLFTRCKRFQTELMSAASLRFSSLGTTGIYSSANERSLFFTADARAGRALSFPRVARAIGAIGSWTKVGLVGRDGDTGYGRRTITLPGNPGNRRRSRFTTRALGGVTLRSYVRTDGQIRTDELRRAFLSGTHARSRRSRNERTVIVHACTYVQASTHARTVNTRRKSKYVKTDQD